MSHIVPSSCFSFVFVNVTSISAKLLFIVLRILVFQQFCLLYISALSLWLQYCWDYFFPDHPCCWNISSYFRLIALVFLLGLPPPTLLFPSCVSKEAPQAVLLSYISVTISSNNFSLIPWKWGNTVYKAQCLFWLWSVFSSLLFLVAVIPTALVSWVVSFTFSAMVRIISSFCPPFPFLFHKLFI